MGPNNFITILSYDNINIIAMTHNTKHLKTFAFLRKYFIKNTISIFRAINYQYGTLFFNLISIIRCIRYIYDNITPSNPYCNHYQFIVPIIIILIAIGVQRVS